MHNVLSSRMHLLQDSITKNADILQEQAAVLTREDKELLSSFKGTLTAIHSEVSHKLSGKTQGADASYSLRLRELDRQLEFSKAAEDKFKALSQSLEQELERNKELIDTLFFEKEELVKELTQAQKEIANQKAQIAQLKKENAKLTAENEDWRESAVSRSRRSTSYSITQNVPTGAAGTSPSAGRPGSPRSSSAGPAKSTDVTPQRDLSTRMDESEALRIANELTHGITAEAQSRVPSSGHSRPGSAVTHSSLGGNIGTNAADGTIMGTGFEESELHEVIYRLKTMLDQERRTSKTLREDLISELEKKTEAENLIRKAIDEARSAIEMERRQVIMDERYEASIPAQQKRLSRHSGEPILNSEQRSALLASLLSQDRVLSSIVSVIFPDRAT